MYSGDPTLLKHLGEGGNYGVVAYGNLIIIDTDGEEAKRAVHLIPPILLQLYVLKAA